MRLNRLWIRCIAIVSLMITADVACAAAETTKWQNVIAISGAKAEQ